MSKKQERPRLEQLKADAKTHAAGGKLTVALDLYCRAAELAPNDPWLSHSAAELARRVKRDDVAAVYLRRAAAAFVANGHTRHALPALRNAWLLLRARLPATELIFREVTAELAAVQRALGFDVDATTTEELALAASKEHGLALAACKENGLALESEPPRAPLESLVRSLSSPAPAPSSTHPPKPSFIAWLRRTLCA